MPRVCASRWVSTGTRRPNNCGLTTMAATGSAMTCPGASSMDSKGKVVKAEPFLSGFLVDEKGDPPMWGRPVDVLVMKDGSLLVSDDYNGILYRVSYKK